MQALSTMDRCSRARGQAAAARKREWYARGSSPWPRSRSVVKDVKFSHSVLLRYARSGKPFDPYWWA